MEIRANAISAPSADPSTKETTPRKRVFTNPCSTSGRDSDSRSIGVSVRVRQSAVLLGRQLSEFGGHVQPAQPATGDSTKRAVVDHRR